jgi:hypothetical protein
MRTATVTMSAKELERQVAEQLGMSVRQVQRLRDAYVDRGPAGLVSGRRGKRSNRAHSDAFRHQVLDIVRSRYAGFGPTLAHEKLLEQHGFGPSLETLRPGSDPLGRPQPIRFAVPVRIR